MTHSKIEGKFYPLQNNEWLQAWSELKPTEVQVLYYLRTLDPFGDKEIELGVTQLSRLLNLAKSTVSKALKALNQLGWIDLELIKVKVKLRSRSSGAQSFPTGNTVSHNEPQFYPGNDGFSEKTPVSSTEQPQAEIQSEQEFQSSKTLKTFKTSQTGMAGEKNEEEQNQAPTDIITEPVQPAPQIENPVPRTTALVENQNQESSTKNVNTSGSITHISNVLTSIQNSGERRSPAPNKNNSQIPQDLKSKLEELEIPLDGRVKKAIASHDLSQAYGAVAHVERTWETISNPRGVFLFQITRQPIEPLGSRFPVKTAADWGYTLEDLKKMYPNNWKDAAVHFGVEVES